MTRIFAAIGVATVFTGGLGAIALAYDRIDEPGSEADAIASIFGSGIEIGSLVPLILLIALVLVALGLLNQ